MKKEMLISDLKYSNGFPANIDTEKSVVVQIPKGDNQGVVLYSCIITGRQTKCGLPLELNEQYESKLYVFESLQSNTPSDAQSKEQKTVERIHYEDALKIISSIISPNAPEDVEVFDIMTVAQAIDAMEQYRNQITESSNICVVCGKPINRVVEDSNCCDDCWGMEAFHQPNSKELKP